MKGKDVYNSPKAVDFELWVGGAKVPDTSQEGLRIRWAVAGAVDAAGVNCLLRMTPEKLATVYRVVDAFNARVGSDVRYVGRVVAVADLAQNKFLQTW